MPTNQQGLWDPDSDVLQFNDHAPPHFHARYGEFEATIEIETLATLEGHLPSRAFEPGSGMGDHTQGGVARRLAALPRKCGPCKDRAFGVGPRQFYVLGCS